MPDEEIPVVRAGERAPLRFDWGAIRWLMNGALDADAAQTLGVVYILPGERNPRHYHPNCEELLFVLSGECEHSFEERSVRLRPGDLIRVPAGVRHNAVNTGWEPVRMLVCFSSPDRQTVMVEEEV